MIQVHWQTWTDFSRITGNLLKDNLPARIKILEGYHDNKNYESYGGFGNNRARSKRQHGIKNTKSNGGMRR